ncbi:MAG: SDR family oxidoreductase [Gammaproteobacteria bacterium]|nr:SDR family oxidoreductase [Gammaproteobacteria bacterium]
MGNEITNQIFDLTERVVVITGAGGLLGKQHAEAVARFGGNPVLLDISSNSITAIADSLSKKYGVDATAWVVDITNEEAIKENCTQIYKHYGRIDGLVNNAANNPKVEKNTSQNFSRLENFDIEMWNQDLAVGVTGAFLCAKHYGKKISENPNGGCIVNISSDLGLIAPDQRLYQQEGVEDAMQPVKPVTYSIVKTALIGLTRYLSTYWNKQNVRANALCFGGVENDQPYEFLEKVNSRIPMGRMAQANEYQGALVFMLSDAGSYLNGAILPVEGGRTAW